MIAPSMVFASEPAMLAPGATRFQMMPPLPLQTIQQTGHYSQAGQQNTAAQPGVRANPFFDNEEVSKSDSPIQLASGDDQPAIRLKPIGAAIGLQPIGSPKIVRPSGAAMTIEKPPAAAVRTNPLIGSSHHVNGDLVDAVVATPVEPSMTSAPVTSTNRPTALSADVAATAPSMVISMVTPPVIDTENAFQQNTSLAQDDSPLHPIEFAAVPQGEPTAKPDSGDVELVSDSEPVFFSFSDDSEGLSTTDNATAAPSIEMNHDGMVSEAIAPEVLATEPITTEPIAIEPAPMEAVTKHPESVALPNPAANHVESNIDDNTDEIASELPAPVSIEDPAEPQFPAVTLQPLSDVATSPAELMELSDRDTLQRRSPSINVAPEINQRAGQARKPAKRYRPPVAVESPPLGFERITEQASLGTVQPVSPPTLNGSHGDAPENEFTGKVSQPAGSPIPLYMTQAQVRSLTIGGELRRVSIEDQNVCRAIASGSNELKLIGAGRGVTRLVVWADGTPDAPSRVQHFDVHVQDAVEATGDTIGDKAELLTRTIQQSFPDSRVRVITEGDHLVISGSCTSEETATKILRLVRKTCLIPVHDELKVR
ncbi:pilus assembly protein N-terminal domain-containing protein [Novipirellula sp.]|uniref:pilus assembly protein N-terminal domain-containing protein n=1 Tax=Novipirellula sp. TaxID=2795430 RepID=UPI00356687EC